MQASPQPLIAILFCLSNPHHILIASLSSLLCPCHPCCVPIISIASPSSPLHLHHPHCAPIVPPSVVLLHSWTPCQPIIHPASSCSQQWWQVLGGVVRVVGWCSLVMFVGHCYCHCCPPALVIAPTLSLICSCQHLLSPLLTGARSSGGRCWVS